MFDSLYAATYGRGANAIAEPDSESERNVRMRQITLMHMLREWRGVELQPLTTTREGREYDDQLAACGGRDFPDFRSHFQLCRKQNRKSRIESRNTEFNEDEYCLLPWGNEPVLRTKSSGWFVHVISLSSKLYDMIMTSNSNGKCEF